MSRTNQDRQRKCSRLGAKAWKGKDEDIYKSAHDAYVSISEEEGDARGNAVGKGQEEQWDGGGWQGEAEEQGSGGGNWREEKKGTHLHARARRDEGNEEQEPADKRSGHNSASRAAHERPRALERRQTSEGEARNTSEARSGRGFPIHSPDKGVLAGLKGLHMGGILAGHLARTSPLASFPAPATPPSKKSRPTGEGPSPVEPRRRQSAAVPAE